MTAPSLSGSVITITNSADGSQSVTIPVGTNYVLVLLSGWRADSIGVNGITLGGTALSELASIENSSYQQGYIWGLASPSTGSQTLAWDWAGTQTEGGVLHVIPLQDVNTSAPVTDWEATSGIGANLETAAITTSADDLIVILYGGYGSGGSLSISDQTELVYTVYNSSNVLAGSKAGVSGTTTVTGDYISGGYCSLIGISINGAATAPAASLVPANISRRMAHILGR